MPVASTVVRLCPIDVAQSPSRSSAHRGAAHIAAAGSRRRARSVGCRHPTCWLQRARGRQLAALAWLLTVLYTSGCSSCERSPAPSEGVDAGPQAHAAATVVAAPAGVIAELFVAKPEPAYRSVRQLVGSAVPWMPASFSMLVGTVLGLPAAAAAQIGADAPLVGVLAERDGGRIHGAIGMALLSGDALLAALATGPQRSHVAKPDSVSGMTVLSPVQAGPGHQIALGVAGRYLLAAASVEDLKTYGPYVAHTLPSRKLPTEAAVIVALQPALAGPIPRRIQQLWTERRKGWKQADRPSRQQHPAKVPDFADPATALLGIDAAVHGLVEALKSARQARIVLEPHPDHMEVRLEVTAREQGSAAELISQMALGDLAALIELPVGTVVGISARTSKQTRVASARSLTEGIAELFGERLRDPDRGRLRQTLVDLAESRGDQMAYGVLLADAGPSVVMRGQVENAQTFERGVQRILRLLRLRAVTETVRQFVGEVGIRQKTVTIAGVEGPVQRAELFAKSSLTRQAPAGAARAAPQRQSIELLWRVAEGVVHGSAGQEASGGLVALVAAASQRDRSLSSDEAVASAVARARDSVSFALLVQPLTLGLGGPAGTGSAPVLFTVGRKARVGWLRADIHPAALRAFLPNRLPR